MNSISELRMNRTAIWSLLTLSLPLLALGQTRIGNVTTESDPSGAYFLGSDGVGSAAPARLFPASTFLAQPITIAILPDMQNSSLDTTSLDELADYIIANATVAIHMGDAVNTYSSSTEWGNFKTWLAQPVKDAGLSFINVTGNHDLDNVDARTATTMETYFPLSWYSGQPDYGGAYDATAQNTYWLIENGNQSLLVFALEINPRTAVLSWVATTAAANPDAACWVATHHYLGNGIPGQRETSPIVTAAMTPETLWQDHLIDLPTLTAIFCGHLDNPPTWINRITGNAGNAVVEVKSNWQSTTVDHLCRLLTWNPESGAWIGKVWNPTTATEVTSDATYPGGTGFRSVIPGGVELGFGLPSGVVASEGALHLDATSAEDTSLAVSGAEWSLLGAENETDSTIRAGRIGVYNWTTADNPLTVYSAYVANAADATLSLGGGTSVGAPFSVVEIRAGDPGTDGAGTKVAEFTTGGLTVDSGNIQVGGTTAESTAMFGLGSEFTTMGANVDTADSARSARAGLLNHDLTGNPLTIYSAYAAAANNASLSFGGNTSVGAPFSSIEFWTGDPSVDGAGTKVAEFTLNGVKVDSGNLQIAGTTSESTAFYGLGGEFTVIGASVDTADTVRSARAGLLNHDLTGNPLTIYSAYAATSESASLSLGGGTSVGAPFSSVEIYAGVPSVDGGGTKVLSVTTAGLEINGGPLISTGTGVPSAGDPNGSLYLRTDGTGPNLYVRENGAWVAK